MSSLLYEDDDWLIVTGYTYDELDEFAEWELNNQGERRFDWFYSGLYAVHYYAQVDKATGDVYVLQIDTGDRILE
jgi:hypothetical protein